MTRASGARRGRSVVTRMTLLASVGLLVPVAVVGWLAYAAVRDLSAQVLREREALARTVAARVDRTIRYVFETLAAAPLAPRFDVNDEDVRPERQALHAALVGSRALDAVLLADTGGSIRLEEPVRAQPRVTNLLSIPEARVALETGRPMITPLLPDGDGGWRQYFVTPVRDGRGDAVALLAGVREGRNDALAQLLPDLQAGASIGTCVVDERGVVLAASDPALVGRPSPHGQLVRSLIAGRRAVVLDLAEDRGPEALAFAPVTLARWGVLIHQPHDEAFAAAHALRRRLLMVVPMLLAVGLLFAWGAAQSVRQPLSVLTRAAERIAGGRLGEPVPPLPGDEIGRLGRSFETMRQALARSLDQVREQNQRLEARVAERTAALEAAQHEVQAHADARGRLLRRVISAQEEERKRLARELHDETCQKLAALGIRLETALASDAPAVVRERVAEARALVARTVEDVHAVIFDLRPSVLDDLGLLPAIRWYAARRLEPLGIAVRFEFDDEIGARLAPEVETSLFRAVQEALNNVARHSYAENVVVEASVASGWLEVQVEDDGVGFEVATATTPSESGRGLGILGLHERVELVGGAVHIESTPGDGTSVRMRVPAAGAAGRAVEAGAGS